MQNSKIIQIVAIAAACVFFSYFAADTARAVYLRPTVMATDYTRFTAPGQKIEIKWVVKNGAMLTTQFVRWGTSPGCLVKAVARKGNIPKVSFKAPAKGPIYFRIFAQNSRMLYYSPVYAISIIPQAPVNRKNISTIAKPVIKIVPAPCKTYVTISIKSKTPGAMIRCAVNGKAPATRQNNRPFSYSLKGSKNITVRAVAFWGGLKPSSVATGSFTRPAAAAIAKR